MNLRIRDGTVDVGACEGRADTYFALAAPDGVCKGPFLLYNPFVV